MDTLAPTTASRRPEWDQWATNQVDSFRSLGANSIGITFPFYTDSISSNNFYAKSVCGAGATYETPPPSFIAQIVDIAHAAGLTVLLRPYLDQTNLVATDLLDWRGVLRPTDPRLWFSNYLAALAPYLAMAQAHGVEHFAISTELESMAPNRYWSRTIAAVASSVLGRPGVRGLLVRQR